MDAINTLSLRLEEVAGWSDDHPISRSREEGSMTLVTYGHSSVAIVQCSPVLSLSRQVIHSIARTTILAALDGCSSAIPSRTSISR